MIYSYAKVFSLLVFLCCNCGFSARNKFDDNKPTAKEVLDYFNEIAFGSEINQNTKKVIKKWATDLKIFVDATPENEVLDKELALIINDLNSLVKPIRLQRVKQKKEANYIIFLGDATQYVSDYEPTARQLVANNRGLFVVYNDNYNHLYKGSMYVDLSEVDEVDAQKHLLREELTQSLGLMNDSHKYPRSIFYQSWSTTTQFTNIDKEIIKLLYNPYIKSGMGVAEVERTFDKIK